MPPMDSRVDILEALGLTASLEGKLDRERILNLYFTELRSGSTGVDVNTMHAMVKRSIGVMHAHWPQLTRGQCRQHLATHYPARSRSGLDEAIDIALRIWLMIDSRDDSVTGYPRRWGEDESVQDIVLDRFPWILQHENKNTMRFPRQFRAVDLERISGIVIQWTAFLDEHLWFNDDNRTLKIFNHKAWLIAVMNREPPCKDPDAHLLTSSKTSSLEAGLTQALLAETIKTLDLLFPPWHDRTVKFLLEQGQDFHLLPPVPRDLPRLREFSYWHERLMDIIVEFESPPRNWKHIWRDRRYPVAFWTFWLGLSIFAMTLLFGLIGSVLAALALRAAVEQVKLASV